MNLTEGNAHFWLSRVGAQPLLSVANAWELSWDPAPLCLFLRLWDPSALRYNETAQALP